MLKTYLYRHQSATTAQPDNFRLQYRRCKVEPAQLPVDFVAVEPDSIQVVSKRGISPTVVSSSALTIASRNARVLSNSSAAVAPGIPWPLTKRRFQRRVFINGLNTNVMKPVLKEIVFIVKRSPASKAKSSITTRNGLSTNRCLLRRRYRNLCHKCEIDGDGRPPSPALSGK